MKNDNAVRLKRIANVLREEANRNAALVYLADDLLAIINDEGGGSAVLTPEEVNALRHSGVRANIIPIIKALRARTYMGLAEAKGAVEAEIIRLGIPDNRF